MSSQKYVALTAKHVDLQLLKKQRITLETLKQMIPKSDQDDIEGLLNMTDQMLTTYIDPGARQAPSGASGVLTGRVDRVDAQKGRSDGSTADYYELPGQATQLQHLISFKNMNGQMAEIFRKNYRYGEASHSEKLREAKGIKYYIEAEIERLEKYEL